MLGVAFVLEGISTFKAVGEFNRGAARRRLTALRASKDPALFTVVLEDIAALAGLIVAPVGIAIADVTGNPMADGIASIVIGLILGAVAIFMSVEIRSLIVGEAASPAVRTGLRDIIRAEVGRRTADPRHQRDPHHAPRAATTCSSRRASTSTTADRRGASRRRRRVSSRRSRRSIRR